MPVYEYQGQFYELSETDPAVAKNKILASLGQGGGPAKESTILGEVARGAKQLVSSTRTGIGALVSPEEAASAGVERSQQIAKDAGEGPSFAAVRRAYEEQGLLPAAGEVVSQIPRALAGQVPQLAALAGGAKLGAMAGSPLGPAGAIGGGILGAGAAMLPQFFGANVERQAAEQMRLDQPVDIDRGSAALAAAGQAGAEAVGTGFVLGKRVVKGLLGITDDAALVTAQAREKLIKAAAQSRLGAAGRGAAVGLAEIPVEIAQAVMERAQAGLDVLSPEALTEYGENAYLAGLVGPTIGAGTRVLDRGAAVKKAAAVEQEEATQQRLAARAAEEAKRKDPSYALQLDADYQAAVEQMKALQAAVPKNPGKDALPEERMAFQEAKNARDTHLREVLQPLADEYVPRKAEISQLRERRRVEGLTQEDYMLEQMGVKPEAIAGLSQEDYLLQQLNAPPPAAAAPEAAPSLDTYAQERMALANERLYGVAEPTDYVEYLLQQPEMAAQLVATNAKLPGLGKKDNAAVLGGLKLKIAEQSKEQAVALAESRPDLAPLVAEKPDPIALWKASLEQSDEQTKEELLGLDFESALGAGASPVVATPEQIKPIQNPQVLLRQIDNLVTARDAADKATNDAFGAGNKELGVKKAQEREAAQTAINSVEQSEGPARAIVSLRKAQDTALMNVAQLADDLRAGRTLGGPEAGTASSTPETLTNQINEQRALFIRTAIQEAALTRRLFGRSLTQDEALKAGLEMKDVFDEWVTRSMAQPRSAVLEEQIVQPAQMRGTQLVRGAETAMVDPRPPEERRFGAYRAATEVLQEQLRKISSQLVSVPKGAATREEAVIRRQSAESEAAKVAEASGETAQTLAGQLRRRRDYVGGLIDQAFQTRRVPGIAETLLTRAQDFMPNSTNAFLDAAENIASRIVRGQNVERGDLVTMRDELRAASARPGEAEVVGEREGQRELFPAEERRALAPKMVGTDLQGKPVPKTGALGLIREKPEAFEAVRAKEAAKAKRANAAIQKSEKLTQDIKDALAQFDKDRQAELAKQVEESESSLQSAWQSAVKKAKEMVVAARRVAQKPKIDALKAELSAIRKGGVTGLNKETVDRFIAAQAALESIDAEINDAVNAAEFLPFTAANKWVAFAKGRVEQAKEALAAAKTPQNVQALNQQELALRQAEQARLQSLKGEEKIAEAARMRAAQGQVRDVKGQELPGVRRVAGRVEKIKPAERAEERATTEAERAERAEGERAARAAEREEEQADLEQSILDLGTQVAELAAAKKRARTPENKAKLQEQIAALTKAAQIAQAQLDALGEVKPRRKGPATVLSGAGLAKGRPLRTGTGEPRSTFLGQANVLAEQLRAQTPAQKAAVQKEEAAVDKAAQEKKSPKALKATAYEEYDRFSRGVEVESPDLNAEQVTALEDNDVGQALSLLASDKRADPVHRAVAQRLAMLLDATDVELSASLKDDQGREVFGMALASGKKIRLSRAGGLTHELLLHEGTHAAAERVLMAPESALTPLQLAAKRELQALFAAVQRDPSITSTEAKASLSEFVAEVMSNRKLQQQLAKKPWRAADALKAFKSVILRLLGIRETQSMLGASMKAIDAIFLPTSAQPAQNAGPVEAEQLRYARPQYAPGAANAGRVADMIIGKQPTMLDSVMKNMGLAFRTQVIDALAPLEKIANTSMDALKGTQMMYYLRMYGMRNNMTAEAISNGVVQLKQLDRKDGDKEWVIESEKGVNIKDMVKRLAQKDVVQAAGSPDAANRLFTLYLAALRGERVGYNKLSFGRAAAESELKEIERELASPRLTPEDKPRLLQRKAYLEKNIDSMPTAADFKAAKDEIEANAPLKAAFDEVRGMYNEYNANLLNFLVDTGAMSKTEAQRLLKNGDYIPYYRMRGGNAELVIGGETPIRVGNLKDSPHLQEMVGGEEPIFNFLDSSVQNTSMLLDMALRNVAAKNVAYELADVGLASKPVKASQKGAPKGSLEFKKDGVDYFVVVNTDHIGVPSDLLVKGMAGIPTMLPVGIRLLGIPARILRRAVTSTPIFAAKQLFRDSTAAFMISGANSVPLLGALRKLGKTSPLESRGITGGQTFTGMPEDIGRLLREMQEGRPGWSKAFAKMEALSIEADAATRRAQYESYLNQGLSEMEATLMALESMNFSKRGLSPTMHMASTLVPFLNSQIQGLDVLYKAMTGKMPFNEKLDIQRKLFTRGAMMFMGTMAYAAAMQDDEEYKNAPPDVKYGNWFVRVPFLDQYAGEPVTVRVPIPFEIGYIFKALPEMLYNSMQSEAGAKDALKALNHILIQMVPGGSSMVPVQIGDVKIPAPVIIPAAMKPVIEVGLGKSFFTGRDLESAREQQAVPGMRYRPGTSEIAKYIGEATNFSPIKIETLVGGYTGGLGLAMLHALSLPLPKAATEVPEKRWTELPLVGSSFQASDASGIVNDVYERLQKVTQASDTYKGLVDSGETGKAQAFLQKNLPLMSLDGIAGDYRKDMGDLSKDERMIRGAPSLTAEEKTKLLAQIRQTKIMIATQVRTLLAQTSEASERRERQSSLA